uniref:Uncharacterized protein n=1 Tax=Oryza nivara TaxID=4536 RepID=A0A0E0FKI4_ORYNI
MATLSYALCFAIVAGAIAASLWAMLSSRKRPPSDGSSPPHAVDDAAAASIGSAGASAMWSSRWSGVRPAWLLLASRAAAAVALAGVLLWDALTYDLTIMVYYTEYVSSVNDKSRSFLFPYLSISTTILNLVLFTSKNELISSHQPSRRWTFMLEIVYFVIATLFSAYGCFMYSMHHRHVTMLPEIDESLVGLSGSLMEINHGADQKGGAGLNQLGRFMQIVYQVLGGAVVLTDVVFWALIVPFMYSSHFSLNAVMGCIHSFNLVFLLIETTLNNLEFPWFRITWPYPFLNPAAPWAPLWYFCIALLHLACYTVYWAIGEIQSTKGVAANSGLRWATGQEHLAAGIAVPSPSSVLCGRPNCNGPQGKLTNGPTKLLDPLKMALIVSRTKTSPWQINRRPDKCCGWRVEWRISHTRTVHGMG